MSLLGRLMPRSTLRQTLLIVLASVVLVIAVGRAGSAIRKSPLFDLDARETLAERVDATLALLRAAPPERQPELVALARASGLDIEIVATADWRWQAAALARPDWLERAVVAVFPRDREFPPGSRLLRWGDETLVVIDLDAGRALLVHKVPPGLITNDLLGPLSYYLLAFIVLAAAFGAWSRWAFLRPLARLSAEVTGADPAAAARFSSEEAPSEMLALTAALNAMQARVHGLLEARARMLRGVSHDLRTPLTRLRQRLEQMGDGPQQAAMLGDIRRIDALIEETLDYLRADASSEAEERVDLASLLQTVQADFSDLGAEVDYRGPDRLVATVKPNALLRAVTNLCSNGLDFGSRVELVLSAGERSVRIDVADNGPGIPAELRARVLEPFFKVDPTRQHANGRRGFGLGLSIVAEIVAAHRGTLALLDNRPGGTLARIELPAA